MNNELEIQEVMRLYHVKRWNMVEVSRPQSVAEHTFGVIAIALAIVERIHSGGDCEDLKAAVMQCAFIHDVGEVMIGDVPTPVKNLCKEVREVEYRLSFAGLAHTQFGKEVKEIVKLADMIEGYVYLQRYGSGLHAETIIKECADEISRHPYGGIAEQILNGDQRQLKDMIV